jgi:hypothetical protein
MVGAYLLQCKQPGQARMSVQRLCGVLLLCVAVVVRHAAAGCSARWTWLRPGSGKESAI